MCWQKMKFPKVYLFDCGLTSRINAKLGILFNSISKIQLIKKEKKFTSAKFS